MNDNSWDVISKISKAKKAKQYWSVGDTKTISLNGSVNGLVLQETIDVYVIAILSSGIYFQAGMKNGVPICFIKSGSKFQMINYNVNENWRDSYMRKILGSDEVKTDTFRDALPTALKRVLRQLTTYFVDQTSGGSIGAIDTAVDYVFLLSEYEILGQVHYGSSLEAKYMAQYTWYQNGNSKIKYDYTDTNYPSYYWTRSAVPTKNYTYCYINNGGNSQTSLGYRKYFGIAPCFCV